MTQEAQCPFPHGGAKNATAATVSNSHWWPEQLQLGILHQHGKESDPMGAGFHYAEEFKTLDLDAVAARRTVTALEALSFERWDAELGG